jgi:hypothetical protein
MPGSSCALAMAIRPNLKKAFVRMLHCFSILKKDELKRVPYRAKMSPSTIQNSNVNGAHVTPASQVSAGANYNVRFWGLSPVSEIA